MIRVPDVRRECNSRRYCVARRTFSRADAHRSRPFSEILISTGAILIAKPFGRLVDFFRAAAQDGAGGGRDHPFLAVWLFSAARPHGSPGSEAAAARKAACWARYSVRWA